MTAGVELRPQFIDAPSGPLFLSLYVPVVDSNDTSERVANTQSVILLLPPFAEELNKSRRQINLQARRWAQQGFSVAVVDVFGTGDSAGEFGDADVAKWESSLLATIAWLRALGYTQLIPWAIRYGALLLGAVCSQADLRVSQLIVWQPITSGQQALMQLLRVEAMSGIDGDGPKTTTAELKNTLSQGQFVEAAGYSISPQLASQMLSQSLNDLTLPSNVQVEVFHVSASASAAVPPALKKLQQAWSAQSERVSVTLVEGNKFWSTVEISTNASLLDASCDSLVNVSMTQGVRDDN